MVQLIARILEIIMLTQNKQKLIRLIGENQCKLSDTIGIGKLMLLAGYSESQSHNAYQIVNTEEFQEALADESVDIIKKLEVERNRAIKLLKEKISKAKYRDLMDGIDKLTKNSQLLSGKATERIGISLMDLFKRSKE